MRFMQAYKRLDALCRDMNGIGVTGYIEDMRKTVNGSLYVSGWNADFQRLKYYRHIRNQIAHEVDVTEEEMCSPEDAVWIEEFHQRILRQTDPLAMHYQASRPQRNTGFSTEKAFKTKAYPPDPAPSPRSSKNTIPGYIVVLIAGILAIVMVLGKLLQFV
ncbi:MAG: DUF6548 family protein [Dysosmobacter sp.]|jgi:hypothetical protein|uniref:DUF6548 family protein n=1 Tax=Dysosmobacter sp. TaxID=2591382 RepID=UPI003D90338D